MRHPPFLTRPRTHALIIVAAVAACYANSLGVPFHWDDEPNIVDHPCGGDIGCYLRPGGAPPGRIVGFFTFALDRRLHGLDPLGFHVTNAVIHLAAALLVYALARSLFRAADRQGVLHEDQTAGAALLAALLFACHPIQTQAVTYVVQRLAALATALYLASLLLHVRARSVPEAGGGGRRQVALVAGSLLCAVLAMRTKEIAFTLPVAVAILDLAFFPGPWRRHATFLAPALATLPVVPLGLLRVGRPAAEILADADVATRVQTSLSRWEYFVTECRVIVTYLRLLLYPADQAVDRAYPVARSLREPAALVSALFLAALLAAGFLLVLRASEPELRVAGAGIVLFFVGLSVESSFIPIVDVIFEHRLYLPSAGAALAVTGGGLWALRRATREVARRAMIAAAAAWVVALAGATVVRNRVWRDALTLWGDALAKSPENPRAHYNFANALRTAGDMGGATREWEETVRLAPGFSVAWSQLGNVAFLAGETASAADRYRRAVDTDPRNAEALHNLALLLEQSGSVEEATALYRRFVEIAPHYLAPQAAEVRARFGWPAPAVR